MGLHVDVNKARVAIPQIELTSEHERNEDAVWKGQGAREHNDDRHVVSEIATREIEQPASTVGKGEMTTGQDGIVKSETTTKFQQHGIAEPLKGMTMKQEEKEEQKDNNVCTWSDATVMPGQQLAATLGDSIPLGVDAVY